MRFTVPMLRAMIVTLASATTSFAQDGDDASEAREIFHNIVKVVQEDTIRFRQGTGSGHVEWYSADGQKHLIYEMKFDRLNQKLWLEYRPLEIVFDGKLQLGLARVVADGKTLMSAHFSEAFHPSGCEANTFEDNADGMYHGSYGFFFDPRLLFPPEQWPFNTSDPDAQLEQYHGKLTLAPDQNGGLLTLVLHHGENKLKTVRRFTIDPKLGYRMTRVTIAPVSREDQPSPIYEYNWQETAQEPSLGGVTIRKYDYAEKKGYHVEHFVIDEFEPTTQRTKDGFSVAALNLCAGSRMLDHRRSAEAPVRNVGEHAPTSDSLAEETEQMPIRAVHQSANANGTEDEGHQTLWIVLAANGVLIVLLGVYWLVRNRSKGTQ